MKININAAGTCTDVKNTDTLFFFLFDIDFHKNQILILNYQITVLSSQKLNKNLYVQYFLLAIYICKKNIRTFCSVVNLIGIILNRFKREFMSFFMSSFFAFFLFLRKYC